MDTQWMPLVRTAAFVLSLMWVQAASAGLVSAGLVRLHQDPYAGTVVVYAAEPGYVAYDGPDGGHSPFAEALLRYLEAPLDVGMMLRWVRDAVLESTSGDQRPIAHVSLPGRSIYLAANPALPPSGRLPADDAEREEVPARVALTIRQPRL